MEKEAANILFTAFLSLLHYDSFCWNLIHYLRSAVNAKHKDLALSVPKLHR